MWSMYLASPIPVLYLFNQEFYLLSPHLAVIAFILHIARHARHVVLLETENLDQRVNLPFRVKWIHRWLLAFDSGGTVQGLTLAFSFISLVRIQFMRLRYWTPRICTQLTGLLQCFHFSGQLRLLVVATLGKLCFRWMWLLRHLWFRCSLK
jgi:hypothetical protein